LAADLCFEVADTGIGIAPEDLTGLFQPFHQVGDQQYQQQGTGLGLAITRKLVQLMGGDVQVASTLGQGSTFWFELSLPVASATTSPADISTRKMIGTSGTSPTILVVDDHADSRHVLADLLTSLGCTVVEASSGEEGVRQARACQPQAIITDLRMPGMDGLELIRQIRGDPQMQEVVVFVTSASAYEEDRQRSLAAGSQAFLPKPIVADRLYDELRRWLKVAWQYQAEPANAVSPSTSLVLPADNMAAQRAGEFSPDALAALPSEVRAALEQSVIQGNVDGVEEALAQIRPTQPALADALAALAREFQFGKILRLLQRGAA